MSFKVTFRDQLLRPDTAVSQATGASLLLRSVSPARSLPLMYFSSQQLGRELPVDSSPLVQQHTAHTAAGDRQLSQHLPTVTVNNAHQLRLWQVMIFMMQILSPCREGLCVSLSDRWPFLGGGFLECATRAGQDVSNCCTPQQQICFLCVWRLCSLKSGWNQNQIRQYSETAITSKYIYIY